MTSLGLIVVGDYALATGADRHVPFAACVLGKTHQRLAWAWFVPADRVQLASALHEAWRRPHPVACFGGLGSGVDDVVNVTIKALQLGRVQMGLARKSESVIDETSRCANVAFFSGHPEISHPRFERWWRECATCGDLSAVTTERVRWTLPETPVAAEARRSTKSDYPTVIQQLAHAGEGDVMLTFTGTSKAKAQGARKALQRALGTRSG